MNLLPVGSQTTHSFIVEANMFPDFEGSALHDVCSTYHLVKEIEWATRQFVLQMKEAHEEGIGTSVSIVHHGPAKLGEHVEIVASIQSLDKNELICSYTAHVGKRLIASGTTGQKVLPIERLTALLNRGEEG